MKSQRVSPAEHVEFTKPRTSSRKGAISASNVIPSDKHLLTCHNCGWPNVLNVCTNCRRGVCINCKIYMEKYCKSCVYNNPVLVDIMKAEIKNRKVKKCSCVIM